MTIFLILLIPIKVEWEKDLAKGSPLPWYLPLDKGHFSLSGFRLTAIGRFLTKNMVRFVIMSRFVFETLMVCTPLWVHWLHIDLKVCLARGI